MIIIIRSLVGGKTKHRSDSFSDSGVYVASACFVASVTAPVPQLGDRDDQVLEVGFFVDRLDPVLDELDVPVMKFFFFILIFFKYLI